MKTLKIALFFLSVMSYGAFAIPTSPKGDEAGVSGPTATKRKASLYDQAQKRKDNQELKEQLEQAIKTILLIYEPKTDKKMAFRVLKNEFQFIQNYVDTFGVDPARNDGGVLDVWTADHQKQLLNIAFAYDSKNIVQNFLLYLRRNNLLDPAVELELTKHLSYQNPTEWSLPPKRHRVSMKLLNNSRDLDLETEKMLIAMLFIRFTFTDPAETQRVIKILKNVSLSEEGALRLLKGPTNQAPTKQLKSEIGSILKAQRILSPVVVDELIKRRFYQQGELHIEPDLAETLIARHFTSQIARSLIKDLLNHETAKRTKVGIQRILRANAHKLDHDTQLKLVQSLWENFRSPTELILFILEKTPIHYPYVRKELSRVIAERERELRLPNPLMLVPDEERKRAFLLRPEGVLKTCARAFR